MQPGGEILETRRDDLCVLEPQLPESSGSWHRMEIMRAGAQAHRDRNQAIAPEATPASCRHRVAGPAPSRRAELPAARAPRSIRHLPTRAVALKPTPPEPP